jgi:hypothetical protein
MEEEDPEGLAGEKKTEAEELRSLLSPQIAIHHRSFPWPFNTTQLVYGGHYFVISSLRD